MSGRNINYFLIDGHPNGRIKCTVANWTGLAYRIPRSDIELCKDRPDLDQSGVYFLFGTSDETGEDVVYVGQAGARNNGDGILSRLSEHKRNPDKDYWTEAVVFTTRDNYFGATEISWLEKHFVDLASDAKRFTVKNSNTPNEGNVTEEKQSELEEFVNYAKIVMGVLGYKVFEPIVTVRANIQDFSNKQIKNENDILFYLKQQHANNYDAFGKRTDEGFVVLSGSKININLTASRCPHRAKILREEYLPKLDKDSKLMQDVLCTSPSLAASFVTGWSINGRDSWKTEDGKTLGDIETSETDTDAQTRDIVDTETQSA